MRYFQKIFCDIFKKYFVRYLFSKIILQDIFHNCSYLWRNSSLVLVKKYYWIWEEPSLVNKDLTRFKDFRISVWKNSKFIFLDLIDRISNNVLNNEISLNKILSSLEIFNRCHICIFIGLRIRRKKWTEEISSIFFNLNLL